MGDNQTNVEEDQIDLLELFYVLKSKLAIILASMIAGALVLGAYTLLLVTPLYESSAMMYVLGANTAIESLTDIQLGTQLKSDYAIMIKSYTILNDVVEDLDLDMTYKELNNIVTVENMNDSRVLKISVKHPVPETATKIANSVATVASLKISEFMDTVQPNVFEPARIPEYPVSPNKKKNIAIGALIGLILSCAIIIVRHLMDDRIKSEEDVEKYLSLTVLGSIPDKSSIKTSSRTKSSSKSKKRKTEANEVGGK